MYSAKIHFRRRFTYQKHTLCTRFFDEKPSCLYLEFGCLWFWHVLFLLLFGRIFFVEIFLWFAFFLFFLRLLLLLQTRFSRCIYSHTHKFTFIFSHPIKWKVAVHNRWIACETFLLVFVPALIYFTINTHIVGMNENFGVFTVKHVWYWALFWPILLPILLCASDFIRNMSTSTFIHTQ